MSLSDIKSTLEAVWQKAELNVTYLPDDSEGTLKFETTKEEFKKAAKLVRETFPHYKEIEHSRLSDDTYSDSFELELDNIEIKLFSKATQDTTTSESAPKKQNFWSSLGKMVKEAVDCCIE